MFIPVVFCFCYVARRCSPLETIRSFHGFYYDIGALGELRGFAETFLAGKSDGLLLISGQSGTGKTVLAQAFIAEAESWGKRWITGTTKEYAEMLVEKIGKQESSRELLAAFREDDLIVLEEYDYLTRRHATRLEMWNSFLSPLLEQGKKILLTLVEKPDHPVMTRMPAHSRIHLAPAEPMVRLAFIRDYCREMGMKTDIDTEIYLSAGYPIHVIKGILHRSELMGGAEGCMVDGEEAASLEKSYEVEYGQPAAWSDWFD